MPSPPNLGKMELRIGIHIGPVFAGVVGIKFPRYTLFGTSMRLTRALRMAALPMTVHVSETVYERMKVSRKRGIGPSVISHCLLHRNVCIIAMLC